MRSWVRKGLEAYLTVLIEALWPKKRILEAYLNLVDWGARQFRRRGGGAGLFRHRRGVADAAEAARLAAILPDPHKWNAAHPGPYVRRRTASLEGRSAMVVRDGLNFCVK